MKIGYMGGDKALTPWICGNKFGATRAMLIAHVSDSHISMNNNWPIEGANTRSNFIRLVDALRRQTVMPDIVLYSGDLGEDGSLEEYAFAAQELQSLKIPIKIVPGNHDLRAPLRSMLPSMTGINTDGHLCFTEEEWPVAIIGLDTIIEGKPHGELCPKRLGWLSDTLQRLRDRQVIIVMHHPPITTGLSDLDSMGLLKGVQEFAEIVSVHGGVEAILCGHMHRAIQGTCGGAPVFVAPSASHQFAMDLQVDVPYRITNEPAQFMLHVKRVGQPLISHTVFV